MEVIFISTTLIHSYDLVQIPDPFAPVYDNSRRIKHYKIALRLAMKQCLTPVQYRHIYLHYWKKQSKSDIARTLGTSCSAVGKSIRSGQAAIHKYVELYMQIYDALEQEWRNEELY